MTVLSGAALNVLSSAIYDIIKLFALKYYRSRSGALPKDLRASIEQELRDNLPEDLAFLFDSGTFTSYFRSPQFLDLINSYLEYKLVYNRYAFGPTAHPTLKKADVVTDEEIIDFISAGILGLYGENSVVPAPSYDEIARGCRFIFDTAERALARSLSAESAQMLRLINLRNDEYFRQLSGRLKELLDVVKKLMDRPVCPVDEDFESRRAEYHRILKEKNSQARIYLLDKFPFDEFYVPPELQVVGDDRDENRGLSAVSLSRRFMPQVSGWQDIFLRSRIVYLVGGAGYGKTLFTKKLINDYDKLHSFRSDDYLVIYGELKSFFPNNSDTPISLVDFLRNSIKASTLIDVSADFVRHYLDSGRCLILLDALDEVEKSKRVGLHETVISNLKAQNPGNMVCITSRDRGFIPEENVEVIRILPLTPRQIGQYVDNIIKLGKFEAEDKKSFMRQSEVLVNKGFLNSFLVLSLLINIYKGERELPENKLDLYRKCFEYIANRREREKTDRGFNWQLISPIMKDNTFIELARMCVPNNSDIDKRDIKARLVEIYTAKYGSEALADNAVEEFLRFCSDRTELFVPTAEEKYKFFHRSFFEFFYSSYIALRCSDAGTMLEEMRKFDVDSEVFELTVAILKQNDEQKYQSLVELMLDQAREELAGSPDSFPVFNILLLAMQVVDDALYRQRFVELLVEFKDLLLSGNENLHNLALISALFENDRASAEKICSAYREEGLVVLTRDIDYIFDQCDAFEGQDGQALSDMILERAPLPNGMRFMSLPDEDAPFYIPLINRYVDPLTSVAGLTPETVRGICKSFSPGNYKKRAARITSYIDKLKTLPADDLRKVIEKIARPDLTLICDPIPDLPELGLPELDLSEFPDVPDIEEYADITDLDIPEDLDIPDPDDL